MTRAILDTDTISYHLKGKGNVTEKMKAYITEHGTISFSVVTLYEVMNGLLFADARRQMREFEEIISKSQVFIVDQKIALRAAAIFAELRRRNQIISHTDVLIAATALENGLSVVTNNATHFGRIDGLVLENWV